MVVQTSKVRPVDKNIISVLHSDNAATTDGITTLKTATFPGTVSGLRWDINLYSIINGATVNAQVLTWAIVVIQDGMEAGTISLDDAATYYAPEQNVLATGILIGNSVASPGGPGSIRDQGTTKTMRKLKQGDQLAFIYRLNQASATSTSIYGTVQFFYKS